MRRLLFAIGVVVASCIGAVGHAATLKMVIQPVIYCDSADGVACATPGFDRAYFDGIFAMLGVRVTHKPTLTMDIAALPLTGAQTPNGPEVDALQALGDFSQRLGGFVDVMNDPVVHVGFTGDLTGSVAGLAYLPFTPQDRNQFPYALIQNVGFSAQAISYVMAHEIGHTLGGKHDVAVPGGLLAPTFSPGALPVDPSAIPISAANRQTMRSSALLSPVSEVPLNASFGFLALAVGMLAWLRRRLAVRAPSQA